MALDVYVMSMWVPKDAGRGVRFPGAKIIGSCELLNVGAGS